MIKKAPFSQLNANILTLCALALACSHAYATEGILNTTNDLYQTGQYQAAAETGLLQLLNEPWNHELRFLVADSLQRSGRLAEAAAQFSALEGTPYADSATLRLNALQSNRLISDAPIHPKAIQLSSATLPEGLRTPLSNSDTLAPELKNEPKKSAYLLATPVTSERSTRQQKIYDLNAAKNYVAVATQGMLLAATERLPDELRLIVANSLAWTGNFKESVKQYQLLMNGSYRSEATIGLANVYRWQGHHSQAASLYQSVLASAPTNNDAEWGLALAKRELNPRTLVTFMPANDSTLEQRRAVTLNHRWRDSSNRNLFEIEAGRINDQQPNTLVHQRDFTGRYQSLNTPLQPSLEVSIQRQPTSTFFGSIKVEIAENQAQIQVGRVNWGTIAATASALNNHLTANHIGSRGSHIFDIGQVTGNIDFYNISDGNSLFASRLNYKPAWTPLGTHIKPFAGIETRDATLNTVNYWSPASGFGSAHAGLEGEWGHENWSFLGSGLAGTRLYGEAGKNWSISTGGKYWVAQNFAISFNLWKMQSWRNNATYRAKSLNIGVETLWN